MCACASGVMRGGASSEWRLCDCISPHAFTVQQSCTTHIYIYIFKNNICTYIIISEQNQHTLCTKHLHNNTRFTSTYIMRHGYHKLYIIHFYWKNIYVKFNIRNYVALSIIDGFLSLMLRAILDRSIEPSVSASRNSLAASSSSSTAMHVRVH